MLEPLQVQVDNLRTVALRSNDPTLIRMIDTIVNLHELAHELQDRIRDLESQNRFNALPNVNLKNGANS